MDLESLLAYIYKENKTLFSLIKLYSQNIIEEKEAIKLNYLQY